MISKYKQGTEIQGCTSRFSTKTYKKKKNKPFFRDLGLYFGIGLYTGS